MLMEGGLVMMKEEDLAPPPADGAYHHSKDQDLSTTSTGKDSDASSSCTVPGPMDAACTSSSTPPPCEAQQQHQPVQADKVAVAPQAPAPGVEADAIGAVHDEEFPCPESAEAGPEGPGVEVEEATTAAIEVDSEGLAILSRARALCAAANQLSESLAPIAAMKKRSQSSSSSMHTRSHTSNRMTSSTPSIGRKASNHKAAASVRNGTFAEVASTVAVINGSSLITCKAELKQSLKRGDVIRVEGREYTVAKDRQLGTSSFELTENYGGETNLEAKLEVFRRAPKAQAPQDPRSTSEMIRDMFPESILPPVRTNGPDLVRPKRPSRRPSSTTHRRTPSQLAARREISSATIASSPEGLGPILEEPVARPATEPPQQLRRRRRRRRTSSPSPSQGAPLKPLRFHYQPPQPEETAPEDPNVVYRREQKALEGLQLARERVRAAKREREQEQQRRQEEEMQKTLERQESQERAKKERHAAAMRLARLRSDQKRVAMEMAASYKVDQEKKRRSEEEKSREATQSLRRLREGTKARMARQKAMAEEWERKEEQEMREQLARRRKEAEAICRQFLKRRGPSSGYGDDGASSTDHYGQGKEDHGSAASSHQYQHHQAHGTATLSEASENPETHDEQPPPVTVSHHPHHHHHQPPSGPMAYSRRLVVTTASCPTTLAAVSRDTTRSQHSNQEQEQQVMRATSPVSSNESSRGSARDEPPILPPQDGSEKQHKRRVSGIRQPGWAEAAAREGGKGTGRTTTNGEGATTTTKTKLKKGKPVWRQAPVPVGTLEDYMARRPRSATKALDKDWHGSGGGDGGSDRLVLPPLVAVVR